MSLQLHLLIRTGVPGGRSSHCQRLPQDELLPPLPCASPAVRSLLWGRWCGRGRGRRCLPHVPLVQQCPASPARSRPYADNIRADIRPLQSAVSCPQNVAVLVSSPPIKTHTIYHPFIPLGRYANNILWYTAPGIDEHLHIRPIDGKLTSASGQIRPRWLPAGFKAGKQLSHQWVSNQPSNPTSFQLNFGFELNRFENAPPFFANQFRSKDGKYAFFSSFQKRTPNRSPA